MASMEAAYENTGSVADESAITNFDSAICMVCAWLVPHLVSLHRLYHRTLKHNPQWLDQHVKVTPQAVHAARFGYGGGIPRIAAANSVVNWAMVSAIIVSSLIYTGTAIALSLLTNDLDYRTSFILIGISLFVGAAFLFALSFQCPQWLGIYATLYEFQVQIDLLGTDLSSLTRRVRLQTYKVFFTVFPVIAPFFCGAQPMTLPFSITVGLLIGFFLCLTIDWGNRTLKQPSHLVCFAILVTLAMIFASAYLFSYGCSYVQDVWGNRKGQEVTLLDKLSYSMWVVGAALLHLLVWKLSRDAHSAARKQGLRQSDNLRPRTFFGPSVYRMPPPELSSRHYDDDMDWDNHHYNTNTHYNTNGGAEPSKMMQPGIHPENESTTEGTHVLVTTIHTGSLEDDNDDEETDPQQPTTRNEDDPSGNDIPEPSSSVPIVKKEVSFVHRHEHSDNNNNNDYDDVVEREEEEMDSKCHVMNEICCDLSCGQGAKTRSWMAKTYNFCSWVAWCLLLAGSTFFIVVMVGAQQQEQVVRSLLPRVHEILYSTMNTGPMCAFDDRGDNNQTRREKVESTQRTFQSPEECLLANYTILHCGACGQCSNWNDLRLQYTTRNMLGEVALECAQQTMWGGDYDSLVDCTMDKTTFLEPCARCWATDYECTKRNCLWIAIRAYMINTVTNLQVGADDITAATCEEAMCEATEITGYEGFVPCSGASRRRMNVTSTISRPGDQRCQQVGVEWVEFFGPSKGYLDYDPSYDNIID